MEYLKRKNATRDEEIPSKSPENPSKRRRIDIGAESAEVQGVTATTETQEHAVGEDGSFQPDSSAESFKMPDPSHYAASPPTDELHRCQRCITNLLPCLPHLGGKGVCFHCASSDRLCFPNSSSSLSTQLNAMQQLIVDLSEECRRLRKTNHDLENSHRNLEIKMDAEISRLDGEIDNLRDSARLSGYTVASSKYSGPETELRSWSIDFHPSEPGIMQPRNVKSLDIDFVWLDPDPKAHDVGALMEGYDSFTRLSVVDVRNQQALRFRPTPQFKVITNLRLKGVNNIDVLSIFSLLPRLSRVEFHKVDFTKPTAGPPPICSPLLQSLLVSDCQKDSWLSRLSCPSLKTFIHSDGDFPLSFIRSHRSVTALEFSNKCNPGILREIGSTHSDIKWLSLDDVESFIDQDMDRMKTPPFPRLEHLEICGNMKLEQFEGIVKTRCLPANHSQSQLLASLTPLKTLSIRWKITRRKLSSSPFFQSAAEEFVTSPYWRDARTLSLSWV